MESFLINYITNLDYVNRLMVEKNDKQLIKLQNALRQKLTEKQDAIVKEHKCQMDRIDRESKALKTSYETKERDKDIHIKRLERDLEDLRTRLEVEKYKSSQFAKKAALPEPPQPKETSDTKKEENIENGDVINSEEPIGSSRKKMGGGTIFFVSAMSIGFVAFAMRFSSEH